MKRELAFLRVTGLVLIVGLGAVSANRAAAQEVVAAAPMPVTFTVQDDHRNMMEQLGITKLRPGPSGQESAPNHANYDESLANPYPDLPEVLTLKNGERVTSADQWFHQRRPEIVEDFEREVFGRVPTSVPSITWSVAETRELTISEIPVIEKRLAGKADNSACPAIDVTISMTLTLPKDPKGPVPVLMMFGGFGFGPGGRNGRPAPPPGAPPAGPSRSDQLIKAGWGFAYIVPNSIQADNGAGSSA